MRNAASLGNLARTVKAGWCRRFRVDWMVVRKVGGDEDGVDHWLMSLGGRRRDRGEMMGVQQGLMKSNNGFWKAKRSRCG